MDRRTFSGKAFRALGAAALLPTLLGAGPALAETAAEAVKLKTAEQEGKAGKGDKAGEAAGKSRPGKAQEAAGKSGKGKSGESAAKADPPGEKNLKSTPAGTPGKATPGAQFQSDEAERKRLAALAHLGQRLIG